MEHAVQIHLADLPGNRMGVLVVVRGGFGNAGHDHPSVGVDHFHPAAIELGEHFGGHDLGGGAHLEASAGKVEDPVHIVHDRVDLVRHEHHGTVLLVALLVDQGAD